MSDATRANAARTIPSINTRWTLDDPQHDVYGCLVEIEAVIWTSRQQTHVIAAKVIEHVSIPAGRRLWYLLDEFASKASPLS